MGNVVEKTIPRMRTIKETAAETGLSYDFIRKLCLQHKISYIRAGNKYLVNLDRLIDYLNQEPAAQGGD